MRSAAPALLPIFRSRLQADILAALLLHPDTEHTVTGLAERFGAAPSTVHGEVKRLTDAGLLRRRLIGRSVLVRANPDNRLTGALTELLLLSWGPLQVVGEEFASLEGADVVLIFGSWAARYLERPGRTPNDLDVLVVGRPSRDDVYDAADRAKQRLGIPVNPVVRTPETWRQASDPLVRQIKSGPFVEVLMPDDDEPAEQRADAGTAR
ncbi:MAG TPA: winged helix-turn-helix domain-containing protein [Streptosporangiaceae bacterium]|jgi:DNA-binding transcriptional ArsR family regulator|nr:winged helix-turn-helix domain-containing protein [Streptosporangiaceae bacterium]